MIHSYPKTSLLYPNKNKMKNKIIQWNINGLECHLEFLQKLMQDSCPEVICIQETNIKNNHFIKLKNFNIHYKNRTDCNAASGGVATYIKDTLYYREIEIISNLEVVATSVKIESQQICICNIYIPDSYKLDA